MENQIELEDLFTLDQLAEQHSEILTVPMLRWQTRHRAINGLNKACVRVGKRLLISKTRYQAWLAESAEAGVQ